MNLGLRRREKLERVSVRVSERKARAVRGIHNSTVLDSHFVEFYLPPFEFAPAPAVEGHVIQTDAEFVEHIVFRRTRMLMNPEQATARQRPHHVIPGASVLI